MTKRVMFFVALVVILAFSSLAETGCYYYPQADVSYYCSDIDRTVALEDYPNNPNTLNNHFSPNIACATLSQCAIVTCTVDCQPRPLGQCELLGGTSVEPEGFDYWCTAGCCVVDLPNKNDECIYTPTRYKCSEVAQDFTSTFNDQLDQTACQAQCGISGESLIDVLVFDENQQPTTATVKLANQETQAIDAKYTFSKPAGTYSLVVSKSGYSTITESVTLPSETEKKIFLQPAVTIGSIKVTVSDPAGNPTPASLTWSGPTTGNIQTDEFGQYTITDLPAGTYIVSASKIPFKAVQKQITLQTGENTLSLQLATAIKEQVTGVTLVDFDNDGLGDATYGVNIYVDGIFRGKSKYDDGRYSVSIEQSGEHTISASYQNYQSETLTFEITTGSVEKTLFLKTFSGECSKGSENQQKNIEIFGAFHVPGKKQVKLQWEKPCAEVIGYTIEKLQDGIIVDTIDATLAQTTIKDEEVVWGQTYTYRIIAAYDSGLKSANPSEVSITLGDERCEDKITDRFCLPELGVSVFSCNEQNLLEARRDCSLLGPAYYCASIGPGNADCKDAGICSLDTNPFGLYSTADQCYGTSTPANGQSENFCYYDSGKSIVNQCSSCANIENCFGYQGQAACEINNCLTTTCSWVDGASNTDLIDYTKILPSFNSNNLLVTGETGIGYCVEENYNQDDQCGLCSPGGDIFENYYCTADVCSNLGRCFSSPASKGPVLGACLSCGEQASQDSNCYTYVTEQECGEPITDNGFGDVKKSDDSCEWGTCLWTGSSCVKDANADAKDDCVTFSGSDQKFCRWDNTAPKTLAVANLISYSTPNAEFTANDGLHGLPTQTSRLGSVSYCLTPAGKAETDRCTSNNFQSIVYSQDFSEETLLVPILNYSLELGLINGRAYRLKYYSEDIYHNREKLQETFVFIDNVKPEFFIEVLLETAGDLTTLTVLLQGSNEPMTCTYLLQPINPLGLATTQSRTREDHSAVIFENQAGVIFELEVSCTDDNGNLETKTKTVVVDLEPRIDIIAPTGFVSQSSLTFQITTDVATLCQLFDTTTNQKLADFITDSVAKEHSTIPIEGFTEADYKGKHLVRCEELATGEIYNDYFDFTVDFTPPAVYIELEEDGVVESPRLDNWEASFIRSAKVSFICAEEQGFTCDTINYCLGEDCAYAVNPNYQQFTERITVTSTTPICYYATDSAGNSHHDITCGMIFIEGYGVVLENPHGYYYLNEIWGVSNQPSFDVQFFTKVPTTECRYDFTSGFSYENAASFRILTLNEFGRYVISGFPEEAASSSFSASGGAKTIYVLCKDFAGTIGPESIVNLEYDPSAPTILTAGAEPNPLIEGNRVRLFTTTDDKTLCKFSDAGHTAFNLMPYSFPGYTSVRQILRTNHQTMFDVNTFNGLQKDFGMTAQCMNGAGEFSEVEEFTFTVDYTQLGGIISISPQGDHFQDSSITLQVQTSKNAVCSYKPDKDYILMEGAGGQTHSSTLSGLEEKWYDYPVRCVMAEHTAENVFNWKIDRTPPVISEISDGNVSCGRSNLKVKIYTGEDNISAYEYEIFEFGKIPTNASNTTFGQSKIYASGTLGPALPLEIPVSDLNKSLKYTVRVRAQDKAGNWGTFKESDGVEITNKTDPACADDSAPEITVKINTTSCTFVNVELYCTDKTGCDIDYGVSSSAETCSADKPYSGVTLKFSENGVVCYSTIDMVDNNDTGTREIILADEDGDGILDSCDVCPDTNYGEMPGEDGCADGQYSGDATDTDGDGLPDIWEDTYNQLGCELDWLSSDSNGNGINDAAEDYDNDGMANYLEKSSGTNPCSKDTQVILDEPTDGFVSLPTGEPVNVLAWVFLIIGLLMVLGGTGYLVWYYNQEEETAPGTFDQGFGESTTSVGKQAEPEPFVSGKKQRSLKRKSRMREMLFSAFGKKSSEIPHVEEALHAKGAHLPRLHKLAQNYNEHKDQIKPGLQPHERSIFAKLESIAKQTKDKKIEEVVAKGEAKDIFSKLREISKKRKK